MKKIVFLCLMVASAAVAMCQSYLGFQVGFAQSVTHLNAPVLGKEKTLNSTAYNGLKLGVVYDATLVKGFGVSMGLNYTMGTNLTDWKQKNNGVLYPQVRSRGWYHQIEIPIDWQYKIQMAKNTYFIVYTGPTLQYGLQFKDVNYENNGKEIAMSGSKNKYSVDDMKDYALKPLNVTWGIGAGFQYERYFLRGGYDFGLINTYKAQSFTGKDIYTRGNFDQWQVKIGMYLWQF
jgi:hypothetical protein